MGEADATFRHTHKVVLSLTSPLPLLYAITLKKITIYLTSDPINPRLLHSRIGTKYNCIGDPPRARLEPFRGLGQATYTYRPLVIHGASHRHAHASKSIYPTQPGDGP
jgi:hypothetical protein